MGALQNYTSFEEKDKLFFKSEYINDIETLKCKICELSSNPYLIYRGLHNASYRLYTSSQRHFILRDDLYAKIGGNTYHTFIRRAINLIRQDAVICGYFDSNNIPINDFLALALLQHYLECSPLIDFTYHITPALYFASDLRRWRSTGSPLDDYVSIYFADSRIDWLRATIQEINKTGAYNAENMLVEAASKGRFADPYETFYHMQNLTYEKYIDGISFLTVAGSDKGPTDIDIDSLGLSWQYNICNPRLQRQNGMFIFNVSEDVPVVENINSVTRHYCMFGCLNINKNLESEIKRLYLDPYNINDNTMYVQDNESNMLENRIKELIR